MNTKKFLVLIVMVVISTTVHAQTWFKVTSEIGPTASSSNTLTLPKGTIYRFGIGTTYCDTVTLTAATTFSPVYFNSFPCTVKGVKVADPAPNITKEVDVQETAAAQVVSLNGGNVMVPALPAPPPPADTTGCTEGTATTYTPSFAVTFNSSGKITGYTIGITCK
jgi:hypothetical protein